MRVLVWATLFVAVTCAAINKQQDSSQSNEQPSENVGPWKQGRLYTYNVQSQTLASLHEGSSSGSATKAQFQVYAKSPNHLQAKLSNVKHAQVHHDLPNKQSLPDDLKYEPAQELEQPFEIYVEINRVKYLRFPQNLSIKNENLLKGLISALQADLSPYRTQHHYTDNFHRTNYQGQFRKMETDVTGDCETLYNVAPLSDERRREIPEAFRKDIAVELTMTRDYGKCRHRVAYHFGVPQDAEWTGTAHQSEYQFMKRSTYSHMLAGDNGIYVAETTSTVHLNPLMYGKQKAEVYSKVRFEMNSYEDNAQPSWQNPENMRKAENLLYTLRSKSPSLDNKSYSSSSSSSSEETSQNNQLNPQDQSQEQKHQKQRLRRESQQSQEGYSNANNFRRYLNKNVGSKSSSSSSSSESNESRYVNEDMPNDKEPAYSSFYMIGQSQEDSKISPMAAQKLSQEIAQEIQNPNAMPKANTLTKFNLLVRVISTMNREQLAQTSRSIEAGKSSSNAVKADMWMIYRDAVTQTGTIPAFNQIKSWIQSNKVQNEEAAQVIASLASSLRYPTKEVMKQFFELASSNEVSKQAYLNSTALIAATHLIHMAHVNQKVANSRYPTHLYGSLTPKKDNFVEKEILPRLQNQMDEAIAQGDNHKAQVMIKAIGNLGHHGTLQAFAPYIEGKIPVSNYLRRFMVENLHYLAYQNDHPTRSALYSVLKNTAEPYEIRAAAALNIFLSKPSSAMMQAMAQMTNDDPSLQVRAIIKSAIQSAANLKDPEHFKLARAAQEVQEIISKEDYSPYYSTIQSYQYKDEEQEQSLLAMITHITSSTGMLPSYASQFWKENAQGWNSMNRVSASFSNPRQTMEELKAYLYGSLSQQNQQQPKEQPSQHKYSAQKVAQHLQYQQDKQNPSQASFSFNLANQQRFYTYNSDEMQKLPYYLKKALQKYAEGYDFHYTKVINRDQVSVMFPLSSGMPFIFNYKEPILVHLQGKSKGQLNLKDGQKPFEMDSELQLTYAKNMEGSVGFYDTLSGRHASAGAVSKSQIHIPIKINIQVNQLQALIRVEPVRPEQETTILHSSFWPYTANQKANSQTTPAQDPDTKIVNRKAKTSSVDAKFGQEEMGMQFYINGYSYAKDHSSLNAMFKNYDVVSAALLATNQRDMALSHYNLKFVGKKSPNKRIAITVNYDEGHGFEHEQPMRNSPAADQKDVSPNSEARRQEMLNRVSGGIKSPTARVLDLSVSFEGPEKVEYVFTGALGDSEVDPNVQYALFGAKNSAKTGNTQANVHGSIAKVQTAAMNLANALKQNFKTTFHTDIKVGEKYGNVQIDGSFKRSQKLSENAEKDPIVKQCLQDMREGNNYQSACQVAIQSAHTPDQLKATITYKELPSNTKNAIFQAYSFARRWASDKVNENIQKSAPDGKFELEAQFTDQNTIDVHVNSRIGEISVANVPIPRVAYTALTTYSPFSSAEIMANSYFNQQLLPYCAVEPSQIKTFSNRTYKYSVNKEWHVVMQSEGEYGNGEIAVLVKRPSEKQQEVYISYQSRSGESYEIRMKPAKSSSSEKATVEVQSSQEKISAGAINGYWDRNRQRSESVVYYPLPDGVMVVNIANGKVRALYDGQRLVIYSNEYRNNTRGICGRMSTEPSDDYLTPYGYVDDPKQYAASYALNQENPDAETQSLQQKARKNAYRRSYSPTAILHSDKYWRQYKEQKQHSSSEESYSQSVFRVRSYKKENGECELHQQVQYHEDHTEICITLQPLPSCSSQCHGENYSKQAIQVACRPKFDQEFVSYKEKIHQGHNPMVPQNEPYQMKQYRVPASCTK